MVVSRLLTALVVLGVCFWIVALRPQNLGGPAAYILVSGVSMEPTLQAGDLAVVVAQPAYAEGDIVAYRIPNDDSAAGRVVIHRVLGGNDAGGYLVQGDNTDFPDMWRPHASDVVGRLSFYLPGAGNAVALLRSPISMAALAAMLTAAFVSRQLSLAGGRTEDVQALP